MPTTYSLADDAVTDLLADAMRTYHPRLHEARVRVGVLMAENPDRPAVTHGGYPALATIKPVPLKDRMTKGYDAELLIDLQQWGELNEDEQVALLDHELSHLALVELPPASLRAIRRDHPDAPWWKLDDLGRPCLKSVPGDLMGGDAFLAVVERHGRSAVEFLNLQKCFTRVRAACERGPGDVEAAARERAGLFDAIHGLADRGLSVTLTAGGQSVTVPAPVEEGAAS